MCLHKLLKPLLILFILLFVCGTVSAQMCGDVNDDSTINVMDVTYELNYLFSTGAPPPFLEMADIDQIPGITLNDNLTLIDSLFFGGSFICETVPDTSIEVTSDSVIMAGGLFPIGVKDCEVRLSVKTDEHVYGISFPVQFSCSTSEVICDSVTFPTPLGEVFDVQRGIIDNPAQTVFFALSTVVNDGMTGPGDFHVASAWFHVEDVNATEEQEILFDTTQVLPSNIVVLTKNRPNHEAAIPGISYVTDVVFNSDSDGDGVFDAFDNCLDTYNPNQANYDGDSHGDACDNCPLISSEDYTDTDGDDIGDICDACPNDADNDIDEDTICGDVDNCPNMANTDQADSDGDGIGDVCDTLQGPVCGDVNCDGFCNVADAVYIINYAYRGGPAPCTDCPL